MGKKVLLVMHMIAFVEVVISLMAMMSVFFTQRFYAAGLIEVMSLTVYAQKGYVSVAGTDVCNILGEHIPDFCAEVNRATDLLELQQRFCSSVIKRLMPDVCSGLSSAYMLGLLLVLAVIANMAAAGVACFLRHRYCHGHPSYQHRMFSRGLDLGFFAAFSFLLALYWPLVLIPLENIKLVPPLPTLFSASMGIGTGTGYFFMWLVPVLQLTLGMLSFALVLGDEERWEIAKEDKALAREIDLDTFQAAREIEALGRVAAGGGGGRQSAQAQSFWAEPPPQQQWQQQPPQQQWQQQQQQFLRQQQQLQMQAQMQMQRPQQQVQMLPLGHTAAGSLQRGTGMPPQLSPRMPPQLSPHGWAAQHHAQAPHAFGI